MFCFQGIVKPAIFSEELRDMLIQKKKFILLRKERWLCDAKPQALLHNAVPGYNSKLWGKTCLHTAGSSKQFDGFRTFRRRKHIIESMVNLIIFCKVKSDSADFCRFAERKPPKCMFIDLY